MKTVFEIKNVYFQQITVDSLFIKASYLEFCVHVQFYAN